jgi:hypothetical protein
MDPNWLIPVTLFVCVAIAFGMTALAMWHDRRNQQAK